VADAVLWAAREKRVDPGRVCVAGASYGGYATLMGLVRHPELYRCGIAAMAVTDLMRFVEGSWFWRDDIADEGRNFELRQMVGDATADAAMLRANSPVLLAERIRAPVLLVHGEQDLRVPFVHAKDMRSALQKAGKEPEWLVFEGEGHGWRKLENQHLYARRIEAFLERHLKAARDQPK
jgi:dipeptidyl aminopeptidase/acylaminoacyl peptidase